MILFRIVFFGSTLLFSSITACDNMTIDFFCNLMQVSILKKDIISAEDFFFSSKPILLRVTDQNAHMIRFKITSEADDYGNFFIKTRGMFKGRTTATYRMPRALGTLEELYGIVGEWMRYILRNLIKRDRPVIARLRKFQTEG